MKTFDNGTSTASSPTPGSYLSDWTSLTNNTVSANSVQGGVLINDAIRYLATKYYFNEKSYTTVSVTQQAGYTLPSDFEVMENVTLQIGGFVWQGRPAAGRRHYDYLNTAPYYNDYPQFTFIWNGQLLIWPTPASSGNTITMNYKSRVPEVSQADVTQTTASTTVSITTATTTVTAAGGTPFQSWMGQSGWIRIPHSSTVTATNGDNRWYQIASVTSATVLTLVSPYLGATVTAGNFTIGDVPILPEDYQDIPLYRALYLYFTSIQPSPDQAKLYKGLFDDSTVELDNKYSSKDYSPVLTDPTAPVFNPNLFPRNLSQT